MGDREFQPKLAPSSQPHTFTSPAATHFFYKDALKPHTIITIGALLQLILSSILPPLWAMVPALASLLNALLTTITQVLSARNEYTANIIPGRATAQPPLPSGSFGAQPASKPIIVFNIGVQFNHPLGLLAPHVADMGTRFSAMSAQLQERRDEFGLLNMSMWRGDDRPSNSTLNLVLYFRDLEGLHRFAHGELHREAWDWYDPKKHKHIGIYHETFCMPAKAYETIYVNCHPVLMGRISDKVEGGKEDQGEWLNSLVSADMPALKTQYSRLSRDEKGVLRG